MHKAYKYRLYPTTWQKAKIDQTIDACRFVYNLALETKITAYQSAQINLSAYDLQKQLTDVKAVCSWLKHVDSQPLNASILNVDKAFKKFYQGGGFPKFKSKRSKQSYTCSGNKREIDFTTNTLTIPKIKGIPVKISREFVGKIKIVTINRTQTGKYFASILFETGDPASAKPIIKPETTIGIDVGIKSFAITSDGTSFEPNRYLKNSIERLKCLQRRASRKNKGSKNREKSILHVVKLHEKIANKRADYVHKITTELIRDNQTDTFVIEDLNVAGMLKNGKLSQAISDVSFGEFFRQMVYKCEWYGKNLIVIDRFAPSSRRCSECGEINQELTLKDREWTCVCGANHDRDVNAAKNIKYFGLEKHSGAGSSGEPVESRRLRRAKKQEMQPLNAKKEEQQLTITP